VVEQTPLQDGRNMTMMLAPSKAVLAGEKDGKPAAESEAPAPKGGRNGRENGASESPAPAPSNADTSSAVPTDADTPSPVTSDVDAPSPASSDAAA
jgi:translation initiation factor IF-3